MDTNTKETNEIAPETNHEEVKTEEKKSKVISVKMAAIIAVLIILGALAFYYKSVFVAAMVDGSPISRLSVIHELEKTSGKQTLDSLITKKLLNNAANKKGITVTKEEIDAEILKVEEQVKAQGGTLDAMLTEQGMTRKDAEEQVTLQKRLEKLLADKTQVTDEEITKLLTDSKVVVPKGEEEKYKEQAKEQIRSQKLSEAAGSFLETLRSEASIKHFVSY